MSEEDDGGPVTRRSDPDGRFSYKFRVGECVAGKYRIESILGSGGMGTVFRAHHIQLDRAVAIKVIHADAIDDASRRFALEARATAALKSAHVVRILDIDRLPSGAPYIVMELLDGRDLAGIVAERGPFSVDRAIHYILQVADAIGEAHTHGIIHRDLKPQNMLLTSEGIVKVLDFGLAKALRPPPPKPNVRLAIPESARTGTNVLVGTPHYMSPEQIWSGHTVDQRTDIWGLGATLFHLLTGAPPFPAPTLEVLTERVRTEEAPRITDRRNDVSPTVDAVIAKCLRKNPAERYQSIGAFQGALLHLRVELQSGAFKARINPGATAPLGQSTIPVTTRQDDWPPVTDNAATLAPLTEPDAVSTERPLVAPAPAPIDNEPTEISVSLHDEAAPSLGSTRKP